VPWLERIVTREKPRIRTGSPEAYAIAVVVSGAALALRVALGAKLSGMPFATYWSAAILAALIGGLGPGLLATAIGGACARYGLSPLVDVSSALGLAFYGGISATNCVIIYGFQESVRRLRVERGRQAALAQSLEERVAERTALDDANRILQEEIDKREKAQRQMLQAQKMEAIGQLTGGVAHDFNNLLTVIFGNLDALRLRLAGHDSVADKLIESAVRGAERAATLTERLLAFARRQPLDPVRVDVNRLVLGLSELLRRSVGEGVQLETVLAGGLWWVVCDPHQLEVALLNLTINGRDAMPGGGKLTVETGNASLDEVYAAQHDQVTPIQYVMVAVSDTGQGMTGEVQARAFEPFFTTKPVGHGSGLGLSMVYGFIRQSGGHVKIYSEPTHGTTVKLYLPRVMADAEEATSWSSEPGPAGAASSGTILVVEDDEDVRRYAAQVLRAQGYAVLEASDGAAALALLRSGARVDLVFTDVVMPYMNGRELADAAKRLSRDLKIVFTTGYSPNAIVHGGKLDPDVAMIPKPFTADTLARRIRKVMAQ
jgi:signal transduction histidine kinase/CheY-like chemotaxis protein